MFDIPQRFCYYKCRCATSDKRAKEMNEKVWKISCSWILVSSLTMTGEVKAACTPTPDCASIGHTETSCEGDSLKCPFDISKLFCVPCDSSFKYDCSGANITGGIGTACGGKYMSCECSGGGAFNNGECPQTCAVGMIYYSDKSCSNNLDNSKTVIGIVIKNNELIISNIQSDGIYWSQSSIDINNITNYSNEANAKADYNCKENTLAIVSAHSNEPASRNAAVSCNSYVTTGTNAGDWYLPAAGELYSYVYSNYSKINTTATNLGWAFGTRYFWSSSEYDRNSAWMIISATGYMSNYEKNSEPSLICLLAIN